jgi:hypothetical protein
MSGWCCAQSAVSLGDEDERQRLLASANAILPSVPRSGAPDRPGRQRQGAEAALIAGGRAERVGVIHTAVAAETHSRAGALLSTGGPLHPPGGPSCRPPATDVPPPATPSRPAPACDQPGRLGPAAGAVHLAGLTALPQWGPCTRLLRGGRSPPGYPVRRRHLKPRAGPPGRLLRSLTRRRRRWYRPAEPDAESSPGSDRDHQEGGEAIERRQRIRPTRIVPIYGGIRNPRPDFNCNDPHRASRPAA